MLDTLVSGRPAGDILSRVIRIKLSGQEYVLPVRSIRFNREWKARLDAATAATVDALTQAGNDWEKVLTELARDVEPFTELLASYAPDVLSRDLIESLEPDPSLDVVAACREVWLAASPLVAIGIEAVTTMVEAPTNDGSAPTSSSPPSTAGSQVTSTNGSPMSSSSPTSMQLPTDSPSNGKSRSNHTSSLSGQGRSTPTTARRSPAGATGRRSSRRPSHSAARSSS